MAFVRKTRLTYDSSTGDVLQQVEHSLNGGDTVILAAYVYDSFGRLKKKLFNGSTNHCTTYAYNLRGWLTTVGGSAWSETLHYNTGSGTPCYNGNISSMTWNFNGPPYTYSSRFSYDGANRLTGSVNTVENYMTGNVQEAYSEYAGYDPNGNILSMSRHGKTGSSSYGLIDSLSYTLDGNQLKAVSDASTASAYNGSFEFVDGATAATEYAYDKNGNLTQDLNRNISDIQYNSLNLPCKVTFGDGSTITYTYAADGRKLRTVHRMGDETTTTDYCGNVIYENGIRQRLLTEEGYVTLSDTAYHFFQKDHLGSVRMVLGKLLEGGASIEERSDYYAFGGLINDITGADVQPYKYNGKELDTRNGLNWYDYGARMYDPALGRWHVMDPIAEKYYGISPYVYCNDNPIRYIDPNGEDWEDAFPYLKNAFAGSVSFGFRVSFSANVANVKAGLDVNAGSVEFGSDGYKLTQGIGVNFGIVGAEMNEAVYDINDKYAAKEENVSANIAGFSVDYDKTTIYDSTNKTFEFVNDETEVKANYSVGLSAAVGVGADISINIKELYNFFVNLFE